MICVILSLVLRVIKWHIVYSFFGVIIVSFSLAITRDSDISFSCPARIEALSVVFSVSTLSPAKAVDRFFAVLSASVKSLLWRNICCSNS
jgi:hypothetical protein